MTRYNPRLAWAGESIEEGNIFALAHQYWPPDLHLLRAILSYPEPSCPFLVPFVLWNKIISRWPPMAPRIHPKECC